MPAKAVEMRGICKRFKNVVANDHIDLDVDQGEVHALLGGNGAGKSTLMNILYGMYQKDEGEIYIHGKLSDLKSPLDAITLHVGMVHQHFMLVPQFTTLENIVLSPRSIGTLDLKEARAEITELAQRYGFEVKPDTKIQNLDVGEQQKVEILKMMYRKVDILILDEPTSVLAPVEVKSFFSNIRAMAKEGKSVIIITHKLDEVFGVSDRLTVLRAGKNVGTIKTGEASKKIIADMMIGHDLNPPTRLPSEEGKVILETKDLTVLNDLGIVALRGISITVHEKEIHGIAGITGNGQLELGEAIAGLRRPDSGKIYVCEKDISKNPREAIEMVSYVPDDKEVALVRDMSVAENAVVKTFKKYAQNTFRLLDRKKIDKYAEGIVDHYSIKTGGVDSAVKKLSGGNMQRLIMGRELSADTNLIVALTPTKGLDIESTLFMHERLLERRNKGAAILLIDEDLDEIFSLSDTVSVIYRGEIRKTMDIEKADINEIGLLMVGEKL